MCQLFALNCAAPTAATFSFTGFAARGGLTDHHADGWGIGFFEDKACRLLTDPGASAHSPLAQWVTRSPIKSLNTIAHIRKATRGRVLLENCHPFLRELWGRHWLFAHNGDLEHYAPTTGGVYAPVGETDSEAAFCALLETLRQRFGQSEPTSERLFDALAEIVGEIGRHGVFNFMLSNGRVLYTHCSTHLYYLQRAWPFSRAHLIDADVSIDFANHMSPEDAVAVIATSPLTDDEPWTRFEPGTLAVFQHGKLLRSTALAVPPAVLDKARQPLAAANARSASLTA
jgi:predicted glutamine amidotransferase